VAAVAPAADVPTVPRPADLPARIIVSGRTSTAVEVPVALTDQQIPPTSAGQPLTNTAGFRWWVSQHYALKTDYGDDTARLYLTLLELAYPHYVEMLGPAPADGDAARLAVVYGTSRARMEEAMASDLGHPWTFEGGGITLEGLRVAYQYPSGSLLYHQRYILLHEVAHLHMMCRLGTLSRIPGWFNEGLADAVSSHVYTESARRLTVFVHDKAAIPNFLDEGLRAFADSGRSLRDLHDQGGLGRGGNVLAVQFFLTDPGRARQFGLYRDALFALATSGAAALDQSSDLLQQTCGPWADLNRAFAAWLGEQHNTLHYVDWGWEQDGDTLWSYGWPQKGPYSRMDLLLPPGEVPVWTPLRLDYPLEPMPPQVGPVERGSAEPAVGCLLDVSRNPTRGSAGLGLGVLDPPVATGVTPGYLRVLVEAGQTLRLDGSDLGLETVTSPLPAEVLTAIAADRYRLGLTLQIGQAALRVTVRAGPAEALRECQSTLALTPAARRRLLERPAAILARDGYHGVTPFFDDRRRPDPDLSLPAAPNRWRRSGDLQLQGSALLDAAGQEIWRITADPSRGARVSLAADGTLEFAGQMHSETAATLVQPDAFRSSDYVFEARFSLAQPQGFYAHLLFLAPRVAGPGLGPAYRISYRFVGPCAVANNSTGFYLVHTGAAAFLKSPLDAVPLAGARYRLDYDHEYIAYTVVRDVPEGVSIRFYLHDTQATGDDEQPLFEYTDTTAERIAGDGQARVQVGSGGLIYPATPVRFRGMRLYPVSAFAAIRQRQSVAVLPPPRLPVPASAHDQDRTELPNLFSDNLVVQQGKRLAVWGRGSAGDAITVSLAGRTATGKVSAGSWRVDLDPIAAGGPYVLTVSGRDRTLEVKNVLAGEVWVLGGQSNMGWWLESTTEAATEIPTANFPELRVFSGWHPPADTPQFHLAGGTWKAISPELQGRLSAVGYYFGKDLHQRLKVPVGLIDTSTPATGIETWLSAPAAATLYGPALYERPARFAAARQDPAVFYNGKVAPLLPSGIAGMVWYQGDGSHPAVGYAYRRYIPALIQDWRNGFQQGDLPFLLVQIPRFEGCSPEMRESQLLSVLGARNAGLAVTLDTGDPVDIHPRLKRPVGERLALLARAIAYGEKVEYMGPIYRTMEIREGKAYLSFDHAGSGLALQGQGGFEVGAAAGTYVKAEAVLAADGRLCVWSAAVPSPAAVRYAWAPVPEFSLTNREGLLASPFRTRED
jgi:sialate O-acetylesterase